ncbi:hypothetical protein B0H17DRAFT_1143179 [Mycena rosella]|uniref:Uncharacterized protein n=1 Tax=Mycena rosella TaxID=1033263 RepID=A0AAD7CVI9_MYCRO|nr:hypothetical protein B0H17DRAFT_1143179 [Mycena rosella]
MSLRYPIISLLLLSWTGAQKFDGAVRSKRLDDQSWFDSGCPIEGCYIVDILGFALAPSRVSALSEGADVQRVPGYRTADQGLPALRWQIITPGLAPTGARWESWAHGPGIRLCESSDADDHDVPSGCIHSSAGVLDFGASGG